MAVTLAVAGQPARDTNPSHVNFASILRVLEMPGVKRRLWNDSLAKLYECSMNERRDCYVLDLEGRVAALSAVVGSLIWILRRHGLLDPALERSIYRSTSEAMVADPCTEAGADRLLLALQAATGSLEVDASNPFGGGSALPG